MAFVFSLVVLTGLTPVSLGSPEKSKPTRPAVPVLKGDAVDPLAIKQVTSASPELGYDISTPVSSLEGGLPYVQKGSKHPIVAMAEAKGWFFYATSVVTDGKTGAPVYLISGYAVKRDGRRVIVWSVW